MALIGNRPNAYEALFLGELPYEPQPDKQDIGLSGLWRVHTEKKGMNGNNLNALLDTLPGNVLTILQEHDRHSRSESGDDGEAIFSFIDTQQYLPIVADISSMSAKLWEKSLWRNNHGSVVATELVPTPNSTNHSEANDIRLAHLLASKSIVIEAAAAVMQVLPIFADKPLKPTNDEKVGLARILANWGPQFLTEWMNGSIIDNWLQDKQLSPQEQQQWKDSFTPGIRKYFAVNNISDPLAALDKVKDNLELLSDATIAERLGWSQAEVKDAITPSIRKHFAVNNISDPLAALDAYVEGELSINRYFNNSLLNNKAV